MTITPEQVQKVADLARLALSDEEKVTLAGQLSSIVEYFEELDELDTGGVEPTSHAVPLTCPERADVAVDAGVRDAVLAAAPGREEDYFVVPKIIE